MDRKILYIGIIIVLLIAAALITGLFSRAPEVSVQGAAISSLNLSAISLNITLTVDSFYPIAIPVKKVDYSVIYNGKKGPVRLAEGVQQGIILKPGSQDITIPVLISNPALIESLLGVLTTGKIGLSVSGNITPDLYGIDPVVPFSKDIVTPVRTEDILSGIGQMAGKMLVGSVLGS